MPSPPSNTSNPSTLVKIAVAAAAVIAIMFAYRVMSGSESEVTLETLPPRPTTTVVTTTTSTTTTTIAPPPVVGPVRPARPDDDDEDDEDEDETDTTVERDPVRGGRDQWGNQRYLDPATGELVYLIDGRGDRIELDDYEALRWGFYDVYGNWVLAADALRPG